MSWFSDLFSGSDSAVGGVSFPDYYEDPKFKSSQDFLDTYSRDLLNNGPNDYYKPIGEYGTPEFYNHLQQGNSRTLMGIDEALARTGRARGGRVGEVASQALGDRNADLLFKDYLRAMEGRQMFFNTGLNTQANVRDAGYKNQQDRNKFNVDHTYFDFSKAGYQDQYRDKQSAELGKVLGTLAPIAGAGIGAMFGNPIAGYQIGSMVSGGMGGGASETASGVDWLDAIMGNKRSSSPAAEEAGVSDIGRIGLNNMDPDKLMSIFSSLN